MLRENIILNNILSMFINWSLVGDILNWGKFEFWWIELIELMKVVIIIGVMLYLIGYIKCF